MKSILFKKGVSIVMTAAVLLSTAGFQAVTAGAQSLGAAHREFVNSSRTNADGHTASSQWRLRDRANTGNFTEDLKTEWQNLCDSFRFRPRDDSASADDMKPIDAIKPFIQNKIKETAGNIKLDDVTNALKSFGRREDSLQDARDNARGNNRFESDNDLSSIKNTVEGYKEKIEGYINTQAGPRRQEGRRATECPGRRAHRASERSSPQRRHSGAAAEHYRQSGGPRRSALSQDRHGSGTQR